MQRQRPWRLALLHRPADLEGLGDGTPRGQSPSARDGASAGQRILASALLLLALSIAVFAPAPAALLAIVASPLFLACMMLQLAASFEAHQPLARDKGPGAPERNWPVYSILVPLYREVSVVDQLLAALSALDYPKASLDVVFLTERDDAGTREALDARVLPAWIRIEIVPDGFPRTKPRALNHGLLLAQGLYVTVFDAEDIPDPDQLKLAVLAFEGAPPDVGCLQARLAIDNAPDGWLPLMMSIEYAALFDAVKCGMALGGLPVALGGTSNHFRRADLVAVGGWDAWNVTEDADLGIRLARQGWKVMDLPSTTLEEAPISFRAWLGQRRRWMKGWIQTGISQGRDPVVAIREMGAGAWIAAHSQIFGVVLGALTFPFFAGWFLWNAWTGEVWDASTWPLFLANCLALEIALVGLLVMLLPAIVGLRRRNLWHLAPWLLTAPLYLLLVSLAAWMAVRDFLRQPFHWEKTMHGLGRRRPNLFRSRR
jgi:glycosyltransferase XagB